MSVTRTTASTINTVLGTVTSTAVAVAKVIDAGASSVDMLDLFVQRAKSRQVDTHLVEDHHWRRNLVLDAAKAQEKIETDLLKEYAGNIPRQTTFNTIVGELEALFAAP